MDEEADHASCVLAQEEDLKAAAEKHRQAATASTTPSQASARMADTTAAHTDASSLNTSTRSGSPTTPT